MIFRIVRIVGSVRMAKMLRIVRINDDTAHYTGFLRAPVVGFGRDFFCPLGKKGLFTLFLLF